MTDSKNRIHIYYHYEPHKIREKNWGSLIPMEKIEPHKIKGKKLGPTKSVEQLFEPNIISKGKNDLHEIRGNKLSLIKFYNNLNR